MAFFSMYQLPELSSLQAYRNDAVVREFSVNHPAILPEDAAQCFQDLLGWLWLSVYRLQTDRKTHLISALKRLDSMWHVFILHTRAYMQFCETYFGAYFHHEVEPDVNPEELSEEELSDYLADCYDHLGEAWITRNFELETA
jgi:hypothetical protein